MAIKLRATVNYTANGTQKVFSFNFDYLRASFVKVKANGVNAYIYGQDYLVTNRSIEFNEPPKAGLMLTIYRETPVDRLVSFAEGSVLKATDLTINQVQTIHVLEETLDTVTLTSMVQNEDGNWDGQNKRIVNVHDPLDGQDVVTYQFLKAYSSFGDLGLDPEDIRKLLSGVTENSDAIKILEAALAQVRDSIPTKTSQLENDDFTVKDEAYVHTDNNLTDQRRETLDNLKEVTAVEFSSTSPYWNGNTLTLPLNEHQYFIALYRTGTSGSVLDVATPCRQLNQKVIIEASAPFSGYIMVSGTIAYGDLNELLGIILNESVVYTYTLEDILGEPYKEPVYPNKEELAGAVTALKNCTKSLKDSGGEILAQCNRAKAECKDYFDLITAKYSDLTAFVTSSDFEQYKKNLNSTLDNTYYNKGEVDSKLTSVDNKLTSEKLKYVSMAANDYGALTETLSDVMYITKDETTEQNTVGIYINGKNMLAEGETGGGGASYTFSDDFNVSGSSVALADKVIKKDTDGSITLNEGANTKGALFLNFGASNVPSLTTKGSIWAGSATATAFCGAYVRRKCTDDGNNANTAGFMVNSDGTAKFVHKRGDVAAVDDAQLVFDATKIQYQTWGVKGKHIQGAPSYEVLHTGNFAGFNIPTKAEVQKMIEEALAKNA